MIFNDPSSDIYPEKPHNKKFMRVNNRVFEPWFINFIKRCLYLLWLISQSYPSSMAKEQASVDDVQIVATQGAVDFRKKTNAPWVVAEQGQILSPGDQIRTGRRSKASLQLADKTLIKVRQLTTMVIQPPIAAMSKPELELQKGSVYFLSREKSGEVPFRTSLSSGSIRGTEFELSVDGDSQTMRLNLVDGEVKLQTAEGDLVVTTGEEAVVMPGEAPSKTSILNVSTVVQWTLFYPGILDVADLGENLSIPAIWKTSFEDYKKGNIPSAINNMPDHVKTGEPDFLRILRASIWLAHGEIETARQILTDNNADWGNEQLRELEMELTNFILVMQGNANATSINPREPKTATGMLVRSYYHQLNLDLEKALKWTIRATEKSPTFGYALARLADLHFAFANHDKTRSALGRALEHSPENAQVRVLQGFMHLASARPGAALSIFDQAIAIDPMLSNAWLGRGLAMYQIGTKSEGRQNIQRAVIMDSQRSILRSYLGKAYALNADTDLAIKEFRRAMELDPNDPTPFLYRALVLFQANQIVPAIIDLQKSIELNDNRGVYRSSSLLDKDQAIRQANLASMYSNAGMHTWSRREASKSLESDYTNASAHLFLANSYMQDSYATLDPRYETAWSSEMFLAQMLMPAGSMSMSKSISQNEYAALFDTSRYHFLSMTEYDNDRSFYQTVSQYGNLKNISYALDFDHWYWKGNKSSSALATVKQALTSKDEIYLRSEIYKTDSNTGLSKQTQGPFLFLGYHRNWSPGNHTLLLASYMEDTTKDFYYDSQKSVYDRENDGTILDFDYWSFYEKNKWNYSAKGIELQQIIQRDRHTTLLGGNWMSTEDKVDAQLWYYLEDPAITDQQVTMPLNRYGVYGYHDFKASEKLTLSGGLKAGAISYPLDTVSPPLTEEYSSKTELSPKLGIRFQPNDSTDIRAIYSTSLSGQHYEQSIRIEPTQMSGFLHAYRNIVPAGVYGTYPGEEQQIAGLAFDKKINNKSFLTISAQSIESNGLTKSGALSVYPDWWDKEEFDGMRIENDTTLLDYEEKSILISYNQLIDPFFYLGLNYQLSFASLEMGWREVPSELWEPMKQDTVFQQINPFIGMQLPNGLFCEIGGMGYIQSNDSNYDTTDVNQWLANAACGYRFWNRRGELRLSVLNINDREVFIDHINYHKMPPNERMFSGRLLLSF